jgi:hypothetical protein
VHGTACIARNDMIALRAMQAQHHSLTARPV